MTEVKVDKSLAAVRYRYFFVFSLSLTLIVLMMPGSIIEDGKSWVLEWWPWGNSGMNSGGLPIDKLVHAGLFGLCGWALVRGWMSSARQWLVFYIPLLALGALTEGVQHFVPGRGADLLDLVADGVGTSIGVFVAFRQTRQGRRRGAKNIAQ